METRRDAVTLPRLSAATLGQLRGDVAIPRYDRAAVTPGIVHVGPGAFHRAHQAAYADTVLADDPRWGISAVALNSTAVADALRPQDGLYTLALLGDETTHRVIGAIAELLTAADPAAITRRLASPDTRLITATVTEKGYCLTPDGGLDHDHPSIRADLRGGVPASFIGWLVHGLAQRRAARAGGVTIVSCDNLAGNGERLARAVGDFAAAVDADLARWIADTVRFPSSMVDSITPATDDALRTRVAAAIGVEDAWPIQRETFTQWVIEDAFAGPRPPFDLAGAQFVASVTAFEEAKLRLLNGAHSTLAYLGLLRGHETVHDAMADAELAAFVETMMRADIAPTLPAGLDLPGYIESILARFRNPAIRHLLSQIAWDGSQKLPFRLFPTILAARAAGRPIDRLVVPVAAWIRFLARDRGVVDPLAATLVPLAQAGVDTLLQRSGVFPQALVADDLFRRALRAEYDRPTH